MVLKVSRSETFVAGWPTNVKGYKVNWLENQLTNIGEYDDGWSVVV